MEINPEDEHLCTSKMINDNYKTWYKNPYIQYNIIKQLMNKELALLCPSWAKTPNKNIRNLKCHNTHHFSFILKALSYHLGDTVYNFYCSVATYKNGIPNQTLNLSERDNTQWNLEAWKHIKSYPFFIDIDSPSHEEIGLAHYTATKVKAWFDKLGIGYELRFSGCGFHFLTNGLTALAPYDPKDSNSIYKEHYRMAKKLHDEVSEYIDLKIYDSRRVIKLPYTLAVYEKEIYVCWSFHSDEEFQNFKLEDYKLDKFLKDRNINSLRNRGLHTF